MNEHLKLLKEALIEARMNNAQNLRVAHVKGLPNPKPIINSIPDLSYRLSILPKVRIVHEVETVDSMDTKHTREQIKAFTSQSNTVVILRVPKWCGLKARFLYPLFLYPNLIIEESNKKE